METYQKHPLTCGTMQLVENYLSKPCQIFGEETNMAWYAMEDVAAPLISHHHSTEAMNNKLPEVLMDV